MQDQSTGHSPALRQALQEQYHAALAMLAECVQKCPDDLWASGTHPRTFWRIALHAAYFTHLYLGQDTHAYRPWPGRPQGYPELWQPPWNVEPYELPEGYEPWARARVLDYLTYIDSLVGPTVDALDLAAPDTGFPWYSGMSKLSHQLLNLRHAQGHVGQLSERLMSRGVDTDWIGKAPLSMTDPPAV